MTERPHEACGIFGVFAPGEDVARLTFFGLYSLQHRGQESAGIATGDGSQIYTHTAMGLVSQAFDESSLAGLRGTHAVGHTRYSTTGSTRIENAQPLLATGPAGELALAHNGNVINARYLRQELEGQGYRFTSFTDSEVIAALLATAPGRDFEERAAHVMGRLQGAYCLVIITKDALIGIRDPLGVRPLCLGKLNGGWIMASESCALNHLGASFVRDVQPGEVVIIDKSGLRSFVGRPSERNALCIFEFIYFARPDSKLMGKLLYPLREAMGGELAREHPVDADLVMGVPDSATAAAIGYARASGIAYAEGLVKNRYVGRTFIQPDQRLRDLGVQLKFDPLPEVIGGKRLIVVDDSIVRGTTTPRVVQMLRKAGAKEIHMRICAPPIRWPCHFGVDMATRLELIAAHRSVEEIRRCVGADTLGYLSMEGLLRAVGMARGNFCAACFTGEYPIPVQLEMDKMALEPVGSRPRMEEHP